jgi:cyclase
MLKKRLIISLTFNEGVLFRTKKFSPDYRYTKNFVDLWNADEIILIDVSKEGKKLGKNFFDVIKFFIDNCHLPITVGGGITSLDKAKEIFNLGVEKIIINSSTYYNPSITIDLVNMYGSSSIIQSIDLIKNIKGDYSIKVDSGRNLINRDTNDYISFISSLNIGEILLNSIDNDGGLMGFDLQLVNQYSSKVNVPVIVQGGGGNWSHFFDVLKLNNVSGACTQNIYHFTETSLKSAKKFLNLKKINVRYDN